MYKKIVGIFIIGLFIGANILPSTSMGSEINKNTKNNKTVEIKNIDNLNVYIIPDDFLDQQQPGIGSGYGSVGPDNPLAQSFIPTYDTLTKVYICCNKGSLLITGNLKLSIHDDLDGSVLVSTSLKQVYIPRTPPKWTRFDFADMKVTPGKTYYIVFTPSKSYDNLYANGWWGMDNNNGDKYKRGTAFYYGGTPPHWNEFTSDDWRFDFCFKTYGYNASEEIPNIVINQITGSYGIRASFFNNGEESAYNVNWSIDVEPSIGLILSGSHTENVIDELAIGGSDTIQTIGLRGIGRISITVQVADVVKQATGFLLGPLVLRVNEI